MAMRSRTPTSRTKPSNYPVYETFQPKSELKENDEAYFLHIYLPGFIKERINIKFVALSHTLKITGERPIIGSNKWNQFDQSYPVPQNVEVEKLQGKFEHGTLIVAMPKKFPPLKPKIESTKEKGVASPRTPRVLEEPIIRDMQNPTSPSVAKGLNDLTKLKGQKGTQKDTFPTQSPKGKMRALEPFVESTPKNFNEENNVLLKEKTKAIGTKGQEEIEQKSNFKKDPIKQIDEEKIQEEIRKKTILEKIKKQLHDRDGKESVINKEIVEEDKKTYESSKVDQKYVDHNMFLEGKEIRPRKESTKGEEYFVPKDEKKVKDTNIDKEKRYKDGMYRKEKGIFKEVINSTSKVVKKIGEGKLNEQEKPLVANMGAAILVIVALGAYATYKFTSSSKN